jgi:PAS domain S-box-containing protein
MAERSLLQKLSGESSELMLALFESAPDAIVVVDADGAISRLNSRAQSMFGYSCAEASGKQFDSLLAKRFREKDEVFGKKHYAITKIRQMAIGLQLYGHRNDKSEFPVEIMLSPVRVSSGSLTIAIIRDITDRKKAEDSSRQSEEMFALLVSHVEDYAIITMSPEGVITSWNEGAEHIKGYKSAEILGKNFACLYLDVDVRSGKPKRELEKAITFGRCEDEGWRRRKDGSKFWAHVVITALINEKGLTSGFAKITRDTTLQKQASELLVQLTQQREDFVVTLTHDLKTPVVAANRAIKQMIEGDFGALQSQQTEILSTILESNDAMYRLLATLLDVYRYESGARQLFIAKNDLSITIKQLIQQFQPIAKSRSIDLEEHCPEGTVAVPCDVDEIRRVIQNLIDNALKFTPPGGRVKVKIEQIPHETTISVEDSGTGISDEDRPKLFERFWSPAVSGRRYASTGLGLYLCRKIVDLHGGHIWCDTKLGLGSTFYFTIKQS